MKKAATDSTEIIDQQELSPIEEIIGEQIKAATPSFLVEKSILLQEQILEQLKIQNKFMQSSFGEQDATKKQGFGPLPNGKKGGVVSVAINGEAVNGVFEVYNPETKTWDNPHVERILGRLVNLGTHLQKAKKKTEKDSLKLYIYINTDDGYQYQVRTTVATVFIREFTGIMLSASDEQLTNDIYFSGTQSDPNEESHNAKVVFPRIYDHNGVVIYSTTKFSSDEWESGSVENVNTLIARVRQLNNTIDPLEFKRLSEWINSNPPIEKVEGFKAKLENDEEVIARFGDSIKSARYVVDKYLK